MLSDTAEVISSRRVTAEEAIDILYPFVSLTDTSWQGESDD